MTKAIFLDIDGTLCSPGNKVSPRVLDAIQKVRKNGHYVFLCSGRNRSGVNSLMSLGFDGVISSAGGYVEVNGEKIYEKYLSNEDILEAREVFKQFHIMHNMEATYKTFQDENMCRMYTSAQVDPQTQNSEFQRLLQEQKDNFNIYSLEDYDINPEPVHKMSFIATKREDVDHAMETLSKKFRWVIHDIFSKKTINGEIIKKGIDKGTAIKQVVDYLHLSMEDTIGFGDSMNDFEMIDVCCHGVVMANGSSELKKYATTVCESVYDDGIYHELKRLHLID